MPQSVYISASVALRAEALIAEWLSPYIGQPNTPEMRHKICELADLLLGTPGLLSELMMAEFLRRLKH
jgi:hypothetical protein